MFVVVKVVGALFWSVCVAVLYWYKEAVWEWHTSLCQDWWGGALDVGLPAVCALAIGRLGYSVQSCPKGVVPAWTQETSFIKSNCHASSCWYTRKAFGTNKDIMWGPKKFSRSRFILQFFFSWLLWPSLLIIFPYPGINKPYTGYSNRLVALPSCFFFLSPERQVSFTWKPQLSYSQAYFYRTSRQKQKQHSTRCVTSTTKTHHTANVTRQTQVRLHAFIALAWFVLNRLFVL